MRVPEPHPSDGDGGVPERKIRHIMGENWLRLLHEVWGE
jgi:microsomal dipeptidase-like Zn-dependent dipeptidase